MTKVELYAVLYLVDKYSAFSVEDRAEDETGSVYVQNDKGEPKMNFTIDHWTKGQYIITISYPGEQGYAANNKLFKSITEPDLVWILNKIKELCLAAHAY
jgi:hypothetical protein